MLISLPEDILYTIFNYLDVQDVLTLRQTCRALHLLGGIDYVWHCAIANFPLPIDVPPDTEIASISGDELQRLAIKARRLDVNWRRSQPHVHGLRELTDDKSQQYVDQMQFLPGGKWLWTAQRNLKRESWSTRMSLWYLEERDSPCRAWSTETPGIYRTCTVIKNGHGDTATLAVGLFDHREVIEVHVISLEEAATAAQCGSYPVYPTRPLQKPKRLHIVPHPRAPRLRPIIHEISFYDTFLVVTIFALDTGGGAGSLQMLFMDPSTGAMRWVDPKFAQCYSYLWVRVRGEFLFLAGEVNDEFTVRVYHMPQPFASASSFPARSASPDSDIAVASQPADDDGYSYIDLGPIVSQFVGPTPMTVPGHHVAQVSPTTSTSSLSAIMFYQSVHPHSAQLLRFGFDISPEAVALVGKSTKDLPIGDESSAQLAQVGALGIRAVWLEHSWETQQNRIMKLSYDPWTRSAAVGMLLPPEPELPLSPNRCHSLAFDEVTGRLCLGMYDGKLYLLEFV